jgi:hypothetical protein
VAKTKTSHSTSRNAGQDLQKEACKLYSLITGIPWGSSQDDNAEIKPRQSGQAGVDVVLSSGVREILSSIRFPANCECKNQKIWDLQRAIRQARAKGSDWILIMKRRSKFKEERIDPVVIMDLEIFKALMEELCCTKKK